MGVMSSWLNTVFDPHASCRREIAYLRGAVASEHGQVKVVYFDPGPGQVMEPLQVLDATPSVGGLVIRVAPYGLMPADRRVKAKGKKPAAISPQVKQQMKRFGKRRARRR